MKVLKNIRLEGIVEGMGMRPAVFRYSAARGLSGYVRNRGTGVDILWSGEAEQIESALRDLKTILPASCRLLSVQALPAETWEETGFSIVPDDGPLYPVNLAAPPDRVPCAECLREIADPANRRYRHAFNACAECGPRTSVMAGLPYDRKNTSWHAFPLCPACRAEYEDPGNRRFHIEGISCPECGPVLRFYPGGITGEDALNAAAETIRNGGILALQGVGGFQLICDAANENALAQLRLRKRRPHKPFALMAVSADAAEKYFQISDIEREMLISEAGPGVLLTWKNETCAFRRNAIAPDGDTEAVVMTASSPLHRLLLEAVPAELAVATSGNISGEPPALDAETAFSRLNGVADAFLVHDRAIQWRADDSVCVSNGGQAQIWRRGRGYTGVFPRRSKNRVLALGAELKNTFSVLTPDRLFLSTHRGDLGSAAVYRAWTEAVRRMVAGFPERPEKIACDLHPDYPSSRFAATLAREWDVPLIPVPHHAAHALAAMFEYEEYEDALVFAYDGTGLGADGLLRGAELFEITRDGGRRLGVWQTSPLPGGEEAVRHPFRQLGARLYAAGLSLGEAVRRYPEHRDDLENIYFLCEKNWNAPRSGAAGRLFDAASALLNLTPETVTYEGQAAIRLEQAARREGKKSGPVPVCTAFSEENGLFTVNWDPLFRGDPRAFSAYGIHQAAADAVVRSAEYALARREGKKTPVVLLTGGVFQNRLLTALTMEKLKKKRIVCKLPGAIPPGDGGISCGQAVWADRGYQMDGPDRFVPEAL